jgi:hypothetical protein
MEEEEMASKGEHLKSEAIDVILEIIGVSRVHSFIYSLNGNELKRMFARLLVIINKALWRHINYGY